MAIWAWTFERGEDQSVHIEEQFRPPPGSKAECDLSITVRPKREFSYPWLARSIRRSVLEAGASDTAFTADFMSTFESDDRSPPFGCEAGSGVQGEGPVAGHVA